MNTDLSLCPLSDLFPSPSVDGTHPGSRPPPEVIHDGKAPRGQSGGTGQVEDVETVRSGHGTTAPPFPKPDVGGVLSNLIAALTCGF